MSESRERRRERLWSAVRLLALVALVAVAVVLTGPLRKGSEADPAAPAAMSVDLAAVPTDAPLTIDWQGRPVLVLRRSEQQMLALPALVPSLADPESRRSRQPGFAANPARARPGPWFMAIAQGTYMGCPLEWLGPAASPDVAPWHGGFRERCGGTLYDPSGRVYRDQPSARNLAIPEYRIDGSRLLLGAGD